MSSAREAKMLINMIGTDEGDVADFETWKSEPFTDPTRRETLAMAVEAAVASFAVGSSDAPTPPREGSPVSGIAPAAHEGPSSQVNAA